MIRPGYACMNLVMPATTSRTVRLANVGDVEKVRAVVAANLDDLERVIEWNAAHGVALFRLGSQIVPFASHPAFPYDWRAEHRDRLASIGRRARETGLRLSIHPGQYVCPASPDAGIVERSLAELRYATDLLALLGAEDGVTVLHVGGAYGDKPSAAGRFARAFRAEPGILRSLALENDERIWTPDEVVPVAKALGVPAIVDTLHHRLNPGHWSLAEALGQAAPTWAGGGKGKARRAARRQKVHISSQDPEKLPGAHAELIDPADWKELVQAAPGDLDVMVEAKGKEQALRTMGLIIPPLPEGTPLRPGRGKDAARRGGTQGPAGKPTGNAGARKGRAPPAA